MIKPTDMSTWWKKSYKISLLDEEVQEIKGY